MSRMAEIINRALITQKAKLIAGVYETEDYSIFKELENNRDVTVARVNKLVASFSQKEILNPIVVNEKMEIVDGQGRYEALKTLGRTIKFIVVQGADVDDCRRMNAYNSKWTSTDFITSYANAGNENYINLLECQKQCKFPIGRILALCGIKTKHIHDDYTVNSWSTNSISLGELIFTESDKQKAIKLVAMTKEIYQALALTGKGGEKFYDALHKIFKTEGYDHKRMIEKCKKCRSSFCVMANLPDMLKEFSRVYNWKIQPNNRIYFEDCLRNKGYNARDYENQRVGGVASGESAKTLVARGKNEI